jgi:replicative superfamily II helicase
VTVTDQSLRRVDQHWAVMAMGDEQRDRGLEVACARLVRSAVGEQMTLGFDDGPPDTELLERLAMAYEIAAVEGLEAALHPATDGEGQQLRDQLQAGAWRAFEVTRLLAIPAADEERLFHILHLAALAYCGDRWADLRRWMGEHEDALRVPSTAQAPWDRRVLFRLFDCWLRLYRKRSWDDLARVSKIVAGLREDQLAYEEGVLSNQCHAENRAMALRLIALYHWARSTELLASYVLQGRPTGIAEELDKHFETGRDAAAASHDAALEVLLRWLHLGARHMVAGSVWWVASRMNSRVTRFVENLTRARGLFELLPPQRAALQEQGLLDPAHRAVVVELPTSGGKTLLAEFRALQALNQFSQDQGWVAYVAPTRALVSQVTRRLRRDFEPFGVIVEQLTGAVEIDAFEEAMLKATEGVPFDVLVSTPEKLHLVIRNQQVRRPLALVVMDEAHNIEDEERGLRIELLLATIRRDCEEANFILLTPDLPNPEDLTTWLAPDSGKAVTLGTDVWQPNERILGIYDSRRGQRRGDWTLHYETCVTTPRVLRLGGDHQVGGTRPLGLSWSQSRSNIAQTGAMATVFSERGTSIAVADTIPNVWSMARIVADKLAPYDRVPLEVALVQRFLQAEISPEFELVDMLARGVGVHHAGLSDEARALTEWLAEEGHLRVLCATTTIAQGINFPVSSVFLSSVNYRLARPPFQQAMTPRAFWNLAGRAGRIEHGTIGVIGVAAGTNREACGRYLAETTGYLVSRLVSLLQELARAGRSLDLQLLITDDQWRDFRCYIAHLWAQKLDLEAVLADTEQLLRNTYGYSALRAKQTGEANAQADALLQVARSYVRRLADHPENASLADSTGFAPEGVGHALTELHRLERSLTTDDWQPESLFGSQASSALPTLIGVMLNVPELRGSLERLSTSGLSRQHIAQMTSAWVKGAGIRDIAETFFRADKDLTTKITDACKAIYRELVNSGPWGLSALMQMPTSGLEFHGMPEELRRKLNLLPAMVYHGVGTESGVLMRMNSVPRSVAENLGRKFAEERPSEAAAPTATEARRFLRTLQDADWGRALPDGSAMSGADCREVWQRLSGEAGP